MDLVGYKTFKSEKEFIDWQSEEKREMYQVSPIILGVSGDVDKQSTLDIIDQNTAIGIFVTYKINPVTP